MFDHLMTEPAIRGKRGWASLGMAVAGHLAILAGVLGASYLVIEKVSPPDPPVVWVIPIPPPIPPPMAPLLERPAPALGKPAVAPAPAPVPEAPLVATFQKMVPLDPNEGLISDAPGVDQGGSALGSVGVEGHEISGIDLPGGGGAGAGDGPIPLLPGVEPPVLLHKVLPEYPEQARTARLSGRVFVKAVVSPRGDVVDVEVISSTLPLFEPSALAAVKEWKYRPATLRGHPIAVHFTVIVNFTLR